ncbi:SIS domain-containing protein [Sapientia aquatica]|uniref:SIS domain-containing protein n=1 Tax=Sapientia aquatica TaxID=1549640 RepID=UPI001981BE77|nr:SIS domain-containing protein [Sapientia aquatica]
MLKPRDVAVIISSSGRIPELLEVAEIASKRGAFVVAITSSHSPLARKADVALIVDHVEDVSTHLPMISRILHLLMIDILAVGVALRRNSDNMQLLYAEADELVERPSHIAQNEAAASNKALSDNPGVNLASPLSRLTSHSR